MDTFCTGYAHSKCDRCQHEKNWQMLNQMPDALRLPIQRNARKVDIDKCRLTKMGDYKEET